MTTYVPWASSSVLVLGFFSFGVTLATLFVAGVRWAGKRLGEARAVTRTWTIGTAIGVVAWMALTLALALTGVLYRFDRRPPPLMLLMFAVAALSIGIAFSPLGTRLVRGLPLAVLVAFQGFRLPLELLMHRAYTEGVMPEQMSYSGRNFDILSGASAIVVAWLLHRGVVGRSLVKVWNLAAAGLLANILFVAIASTPTFAAFGPDRLNTWVAVGPFVWLPTVMVLFAISGHLLVWRKLATA